MKMMMRRNRERVIRNRSMRSDGCNSIIPFGEEMDGKLEEQEQEEDKDVDT